LYEYATFEELMALKWLLNFFHEKYPWLARRHFSHYNVRLSLAQHLTALHSYLAHLLTWKQRSKRLEQRTLLQIQSVDVRLSGSFSNT